MEKRRKFLRRHRRQLALAGVLSVLTILTVTGAVIFSRLGNTLESQKAAARFAGESGERYAQVSVYFPAVEFLTEESVYRFRSTLDAKLVEASLETPENGSLYKDAYAAQGALAVTGPRGGAEASALFIGGDYFFFHPLELLSGTYISGDDFMRDRVVLDEALSWKLFGGTDVAGLNILIGGEPYLVAGVIRREDDFATRKAYDGDGGLYMAYDAHYDPYTPAIQLYELVCADPISGFALSVAEEELGETAVQSTGRYGVEEIFGVLGDYGTRSMNTAGVIYPYWENAARLLEDYAALTLLLTLLCALLPAFALLTVLIRLTRRGWRRLKAAVPGIVDKIQTRRYERRLAAKARKADAKREKDGRT